MNLAYLALVKVPDWSYKSRAGLDDEPWINMDILFISEESCDDDGDSILTTSKRSTERKYPQIGETNDWWVSSWTCRDLNLRSVK